MLNLKGVKNLTTDLSNRPWSNYLFEGASRWHIVIVISVLLVTLMWQGRTIKNTWRYAQGYEQEWVAGSLLGGYGFSFDPATAWLGPYEDGIPYSLTAWVEPLYTFVIAITLAIFGEYGRLILTLLNVVWLGLSGLLIFLLVGEILDPRVGLYMSLLFLVLHATRQEVILYIGNAALAGFLYCLSAYLLLRCIKNPAVSTSILLGLTIGIASLNHGGSLLLGPLCVLTILMSLGFRNTSAWRASLLIVLIASILLSPWTVRNYLVFGKFIPVRSGFGFMLYLGNPGLARTFTPDLKFEADSSAPLWTAESPQQALQLVRDLKYDAALVDYSKQVISENGGPDYPSYNEAERDRIFLKHSLDFVRQEPLLTLRMMLWKAVMFLSFGKIRLVLISITAILGSLLFMKDVRVNGLALLVLGYMFPYVVSLPLDNRYRNPIEPMLFVLSALFVGVCLQKINPVWNMSKEWIRVHVILPHQATQ
jgi:MFS family permease